MAYTFSTRLSLYLPDGSQEWERSTYNANWNILDADMGGATMCTSSTRPSTQNYAGRLCFETDTGHLIIRNSTNDGWNLGTQVFTCTSFTRPTVTVPGMLIYETNTQSLVMRNSANSAWITLTNAPAVSAEQVGATTVTSASYGNGGGATIVGLTFTAPNSGNIAIHFNANFLPGGITSNNALFFTPQLRTGANIDVGTVVFAQDDANAIQFACPGGLARVRLCSFMPWTGLTGGNTYNIKMKVRNYNSVTSGEVSNQNLIVYPR